MFSAKKIIKNENLIWIIILKKNFVNHQLKIFRIQFLLINQQHFEPILLIDPKNIPSHQLSKVRWTSLPIVSTNNHLAIPMARRLSSETPSVPSQGLLLCPKEEPMKKKKKKKITSTSTWVTYCFFIDWFIVYSSELLDDDSVLDSILFNEIQSVQQQWQQFLILTMEKELHINPSDGKKKLKPSKFHRSNEFLLAYENLYNFEGMKHWCPTSRWNFCTNILFI